MQGVKQLIVHVLLVAGLVLTAQFAIAQQLVQFPIRPSWANDYPPFRIAGNLYYVGTEDLACYLITTPKGDILINTGLPGSAKMIMDHVTALGFKPKDIKILLATHAHYDHVGGSAEVKRLTGAKLMIQERDAPVLADGGNSDFVLGGKGSSFEPVMADRLLHGQDSVELGGMKIRVIRHPGHTKGACSFLFDVRDEQRSYRVLIANMPTLQEDTKLPAMPTYPEVNSDYLFTFDSLKKQQFDIWLSSHASQFGLQQKHQPGDAYQPQKFMERAGYDNLIAQLYRAYQERLAQGTPPGYPRSLKPYTFSANLTIKSYRGFPDFVFTASNVLVYGFQ